METFTIEENLDDIVISGISGVFPASKNLIELEENLKNKVNLIKKSHTSSSFMIGKIPNINKFDAAYFGLTPDYADSMDPMGRVLLEKSYEAFFDAGYNPESLRGRKVGVFVGIYLSESEIAFFSSGSSEGLGITGITRSFLANRISYCFGLHGPSFCVDTACSSSMHALQLAYQAMKNNECESAIVAGCNLCLNNGITAQLLKLGVLNAEGEANVLDESGNGYCRAETVCSIFLQKRKDARRIYAQVIHTKVNCDGYKAEGITYPSYIMQKELLKEFYEECGINPSRVDWLELHATGTRAGDREEIKAVEMFCENRRSALKVGSVKSNMGHAEAASTLCSIAKAIIAMKSGTIPPNINYRTPRNDIDALHNGLIEVIAENTRWNGGIVGINSFGLGGANGHTLLKSFEKAKINNGLPGDDLPRIVAISGRTEEAVDSFLLDLKSNPIDVEYVSLLHEIHNDNFLRHLYRGYVILHKNPNKIPFKEIMNCTGRKRSIWFVFSGMGCQWTGMGKSLMQMPRFADSIEECHEILKKKNIDLKRIITDTSSNYFDNVLFSFVGITAMQIALVDILNVLGIVPNGIIGHSAGEIAAAYADNCLTKEQTILCAYYRGLACLEIDTKGSMAAIGLSYMKLKDRLPEEVDIACWNSNNNCTISGPVHVIKNLVNKFTDEKIFAREINSSNMAFHSRYVKKAGPVLLNYLQKVIINPNQRSEKWISTSIPKSKWESEEAKYCSALYQTNNLLNTVLFEEATKLIPENSIVIEVSPHSLLQAILKQSLNQEAIYVSLGIRQCLDSIEYILKALGKLFVVGITLKFQNLYPPVQFPVSKDTRMLAPLVRWQHDKDWKVVFVTNEEMIPGERKITVYPRGNEHQYLYDHMIDGRHVMPGFGYILLLWETIPVMYGKLQQDTSVIFEKIRFQRILNVPRDKNIHFIIHIQKGSGNFEIVENGQLYVSGKVRIPDDENKEMMYIPDMEIEDDGIRLTTEDVYKEFKLRGYGYTGPFRQILSSNGEGTKAHVKWTGNWPAFLDTITQTHILRTDSRNPCLLTSIEKLIINIKKHNECLEKLDENTGVPVNVYKEFDLIEAGGVQIKGIGGHFAPRRKLQKMPHLLMHKFTPYINPKSKVTTTEFSYFCSYILWQNILSTSMKIIEYEGKTKKELISPNICRGLNDYPHIQASSVIVTNKPAPESLQDKPYLTFRSDQITEKSAHLLIISFTNEEQIQKSSQILMNGGFIIVRAERNESFSFNNFIVCAETIFEDEKLTLLRSITPVRTDPVYVKITQTFDWVKQLQDKINTEKEIILYAENDPISGILGFYNCLRKEISNKKISCFLIHDQNAPPFSPDHQFYKTQISKNLSVNVLQNNTWGCYIHYPLPKVPLTKTSYAFVNVGCTGDLRTLNWYQGNINPLLNGKNILPETKLIHVYYSALNFKDVLLATGALSFEGFIRNRIMQECVIGCEFSGRDNDGKRYMGMYPAGAISTVLLASKLFLWEVPVNWSLEDAATIPVVYLTVISAFFVHGNLKDGESVLIHSGAGGVGQAAINIAIHYNCNIFTTVGSDEKREFIKKTFPQIKDSHIGNSRDTTFEHLIMKETKGKGVDLVLNSLAEDKLQASIRCLAEGGRFLEIGKLDLLKDNNLGMRIFLRGISFHCILLDYIHEEKEDKKNAILQRFRQELKAGSIKPIVRTVFQNDEIEQSFRYMTAGKHIGKVLIKIRAEEKDLLSGPELLLKEAIPRFSCDSDKVYIICGGVGGMGLELADWLVLRRAKKLILTSRNGVTNGYQALRINLWKSYGAITIVSTNDISKKEEVETLLKIAEKLGPVAGIFNLAAVTDDKLFEMCNAEAFESVSMPKSRATQLLDRISRKLCPNLKHFVVFSSVSCGYGNAGQTNYGFANSSCERICEQRRKAGLPGLVIQWGAVGDVGMMTKIENPEKIFGLKEQPIRSCLQVLDVFLNQPETIVTSYIMGDKNTDYAKSESLVEAVATILGIEDLKSISMYSPLPELGMDSITGLEIKQMVEQQYNIFLSTKELISLTFSQLEDMEKSGKKISIDVKNENNILASIPYIRNALFTKTTSLNLLNVEPIVKLPSQLHESEESVENTVFFFPPTDGIAPPMEPLAKCLKMKVMCFQYHCVEQTDSLEKQATFYTSYIRQMIPSSVEFKIVAYSYGVIMAMEVLKILCSENRIGRVILIDGSLEMVKTLRSVYFGSMTELNDIQIKLMLDIISALKPPLASNEMEKEFQQARSWEAKLDLLLSKFPDDLSYGKDNLKILTEYLYHRYKTLNQYHFHLNEKLNVKATILKAKKSYLSIPLKINLKEYFAVTPEEYFINENHFTILSNNKTIELVNNAFVKCNE